MNVVHFKSTNLSRVAKTVLNLAGAFQDSIHTVYAYNFWQVNALCVNVCIIFA